MKESIDVLNSVQRLIRAMRRSSPHPPHEGPPHPPHPHEGPPHPPHPPHERLPHPPHVGRLLSVLSENDGPSSRELCELLDIRPSSLSELLSRAEKDELILRTTDTADARVQHVSLTEKGRELAQEFERAHAEKLRQFSECFSEEEAATFIVLCDKLSAHLQGLPLPERQPHPDDAFPPHDLEKEHMHHPDLPDDLP